MSFRSWPQIEGTKNVRQPGAFQTNSTNYRQLISSQISSHTIGDQRQKVGISNYSENNRPHTHDIAKLPSFKIQQKVCQPCEKQLPNRPLSEQTMYNNYKLPNVAQVSNQPAAAALQFASNGLSVRHSTYRSLSNNPNLKVETVKGRVKISRRRPKSLPTNLEDMNQLKSPRDKQVTFTGWQSRSRSPTFTTLAQTKEQLDAALSRKLWEIRRHVDGQRARNNSAAISEYSSSSIPDAANPEEWYERMLRDHSDEDLAAIETLCIANHDDDKQINSLESISLEASKPSIDIRFDKKYLKAHINDWNILSLMQDEAQKRTDNETRQSNYKSRQVVDKKSTATTTIKAPKDLLEVPKNLDVKPATMTPFFRPEPVKEESVDVIKSEPVVKELPKLEQNENSEVDRVIISEEQTDTVTVNTEDLVTKYLSNREPSKEEPSKELPKVENLDDDVTHEEESHVVDDSKAEPVEEKKLTEKEKFLLMRKRMEDRKAEKQKAKAAAGFGDYVRLGMNVKKGAKNFLGALMSSRLEKMATFQSRDDADDEDSSDDEEEEEDGEDD